MCNNLFYIVILCLFSKVQAQDISVSQRMSLPSETICSTLHNGFQYFIKKNNLPKDKLEIRFCLKVGAFQEEKDEEGVAHFIEHLAFDGSKKYPNNQAIAYWESLGAKFGYHINAYTTDDRTIYTLSIPSDNQGENLSKSLKILADWLRNLNFSQKDIDKQKRIIIQEIASYQIPEDMHHIKRGTNPKAQQLPIATEKKVLQLNKRIVKRFYDKWYHPQNVGLVVVGDIDLEKTEQAIKQIFGHFSVKGMKSPELRTLSYDEKNKYQSEKHTKENVKLSVIFPQEYQNVASFSELLAEKQREFAIMLVRERLQKLGCFIGVTSYWYLQKTRLLEFYLESNEAKNHLSKAIAIIEGIKQKGITEQEVQTLLSEFTQKIKPIQEKTNEIWAKDFVEMFLFDEQILFLEEDYQILVENLKKITINQWNETIKRYFSFTEPMLVHYQFNTEKHPEISYQDVENVFRESKSAPNFALPKASEIPQTSPDSIKTSLSYPLSFSPKMIHKENYFPVIGVLQIQLTNGITLYLKPTEGEKRIQMSVIGRGGYSLLPPNRFKEMEDIISHISMGGTKTIDVQKFNSLLYQENISYIPTQEIFWHGILCAAPSEKSALLANLMVEKLWHPELLYEDFKMLKDEELTALKSIKKHTKNPITEMDFRKEEIVGNGIKNYRRPKTENNIKAMNLDSLYSFYKENYLVPDKMAIFVTGNFQLDTIKQHFAAAFANVPTNLKKIKQEILPDFVEDIPFEQTEEFFEGNKKNRLFFNAIYYGSYQNSLRNQLLLKLMKELVGNRLFQELRERQGFIYSPYVTLRLRANPSPAFFLIVDGETDTQYSFQVKDAISKIIRSLQNKAVQESELQSLKKSFLLTKKEVLAPDKAMQWLEYLQESYKNGLSLSELDAYEQILTEITPEDILQAFKRLVNEQNFIYLKAF